MFNQTIIHKKNKNFDFFCIGVYITLHYIKVCLQGISVGVVAGNISFRKPIAFITWETMLDL